MRSTCELLCVCSVLGGLAGCRHCGHEAGKGPARGGGVALVYTSLQILRTNMLVGGRGSNARQDKSIISNVFFE